MIRRRSRMSRNGARAQRNSSLLGAVSPLRGVLLAVALIFTSTSARADSITISGQPTPISPVRILAIGGGEVSYADAAGRAHDFV
jgi:hypothetical protein